MLTFDPDSPLVQEQFAVIYTPTQRRKRFSENCVTVVESLSEAMARSATDPHLHPARVMGPSKSSEGFMLYYLVNWLEK